jgi:hypothetical protein
VIKAPRGRQEFPNEVESPNGEGPCDQDCLEFLRGYVLLLGKKLASLASSHNMLCILNHGRRKALPTKVFGVAWWLLVVLNSYFQPPIIT